MDSEKRERVLAVARSLGAEQFNKLLRSATAPGRPQRFRYWEEQFLPHLAKLAAVSELDLTEFIACFHGIELMPEPQRQRTIDTAEFFQRLARWNEHLSKGRFTDTEWADSVFQVCRPYPQSDEFAALVIEKVPVEARQVFKDAIALRLQPEYQTFPVNHVCQNPQEWEEAREREIRWDREWAELFRRALTTTQKEG